MEEGSQRPEASSEVLKDFIHAIKFYLLDGLPEPLCEVPYGFLFLLYNSLQRANIPFLPY